MLLRIPKYIQEANITDPAIQYKWNEWDVTEAYMPADEKLSKRLIAFSFRANAALTIACAEWVAFRFESLSNDPLPFQYLEAAWAGNVYLGYTEYIETSDDDWRGPIRGPLNISIAIVIDMLFHAWEDLDPTKYPAWISNLVEHVLPDTTMFQKWRDVCIQRLEHFYPKPKDDKLRVSMDDVDENYDSTLIFGDFVPREVFAPEFDFKPEMTKQLINKYLAGLDWRTNPFLRSPEEMFEVGFEGTPYSI